MVSQPSTTCHSTANLPNLRYLATNDHQVSFQGDPETWQQCVLVLVRLEPIHTDPRRKRRRKFLDFNIFFDLFRFRVRFMFGVNGSLVVVNFEKEMAMPKRFYTYQACSHSNHAYISYEHHTTAVTMDTVNLASTACVA